MPPPARYALSPRPIVATLRGYSVGVRGRLLAGVRACVVGGIMLSIGQIWIKHSDTILPQYPDKFLKHPSS